MINENSYSIVRHRFNIAAHIRSFVYHTAIKYGGEKEWEFLWNKYEKSIDSTEKSRMLYALSGTREVPLQARYVVAEKKASICSINNGLQAFLRGLSDKDMVAMLVVYTNKEI